MSMPGDYLKKTIPIATIQSAINLMDELQSIEEWECIKKVINENLIEYLKSKEKFKNEQANIKINMYHYSFRMMKKD